MGYNPYRRGDNGQFTTKAQAGAVIEKDYNDAIAAGDTARASEIATFAVDHLPESKIAQQILQQAYGSTATASKHQSKDELLSSLDVDPIAQYYQQAEDLDKDVANARNALKIALDKEKDAEHALTNTLQSLGANLDFPSQNRLARARENEWNASRRVKEAGLVLQKAERERRVLDLSERTFPAPSALDGFVAPFTLTRNSVPLTEKQQDLVSKASELTHFGPDYERPIAETLDLLGRAHDERETGYASKRLKRLYQDAMDRQARRRVHDNAGIVDNSDNAENFYKAHNGSTTSC